MAEEEERKGYCTTKGKDSDRKIERQGYQSDVVIAMENRGTIGDHPLVRSFVFNIYDKLYMQKSSIEYNL